MADAEPPGANSSSSTPSSGSRPPVSPLRAPAEPKASRSRYAKFNATMDVLLLQALRANNPFTAKHGTRLQMWQNVAQIVGEEMFQDPDAYSWHTCRDRANSLLKLYAEGKHDRVFKHGSDDENARKEDMLREISVELTRRTHKATTRIPSAVVAASAVVTAAPLYGDVDSTDAGGCSLPSPPFTVATGQKRRRLDSSGSRAEVASLGTSQADSGDAFRERVLSLIETKIQFDMDQRLRETELREQEFELQKRFLEYLQSK